MATYNNQHWLLSHIRNSFISTDDTGMCEAVMLSDDLPKQFLNRGQLLQSSMEAVSSYPRPTEYWIKFMCYPGLEQSDDEDLDPTTQSFDIQMYPEIGVHRYRSNTAQKLEKMNQARKKAARIRNVKFDENIITDGNKDDIFARTIVKEDTNKPKEYKSRLTELLLRCPKQPQNKFIQYARFDGTSQTGIPTKNLSIFLTMLPENQRNYPLEICVAASAKIQEVIGYICYKCSILNADIPLQSVRNYGLYITEEDGEIDLDFPPLDLREPCSKFGFAHLALAERRTSAQVTRVDYRSLSLTSETETVGDAAVAEMHGVSSSHSDGDMAKMLGHNSKIDAPAYQIYRLYMVKGIFKFEVQLGISGERIEIDPVQQNLKFWSKLTAISYNIESIAYCEITSSKSQTSTIRIWYINMPNDFLHGIPEKSTLSTASPQHYNNIPLPNHFKHFDFETDISTAQQILSKINFLLEVRSSAIRREFLIAKNKKRERLLTKKVFK